MNIVDRIISPNIWDEITELGGINLSTGQNTITNATIRSKNYIECEPSKSYQFTMPNSLKPTGIYVYWYNTNKNFIKPNLANTANGLIKNSPSNARFFRIVITNEYGTTYNHDICINESNPSINGKYFPYVMYKRYDMVDLILPILPREYQKVEYIESTGTQYIDTGVIGNQTTNSEAEFEFTNYNENGNNILSSSGNPATETRTFLLSTRNLANNYCFRLGYGTELINSTIVCNLNQKYHLKTIINNNSQSLLLDDVEICSYTSTKSFVSSSLVIFATNSNGNVNTYSNAKLYWLKIWNNNTLVRNFIPSVRLSDGEAGLYDLVNDVFYTNAGTGTFLKGENVNNYKRLKIGG